MAWLTEDEVGELIACQKRLTGHVVWTPVEKNSHVFNLDDMDILNPVNLPITIAGTYNAKIRGITLKLMYDGSQRIKCLCVGRTHKDPETRQRVGRTHMQHKHTWTDRYSDQWVYEPDDITPGASLDTVFLEFLSECNIEFEGAFETPHQVVQTELNLYGLHEN